MAYTNADDTISLESLVGPMMLDVPYPIAQQGILWSAIEFCERTKCYANIQTTNLSNGVGSLLLSPNDDGVVSDIIEVEWNGKKIEPISRANANALLLRTTSGPPQGYYRSSPDALIVVPAPDAAGSLKIVMALTPLRNSTSIPRFLYDYHWDAIDHGARYRLMSMANRPWGDPNMASYHKQQFELLVGIYSIRADKDGTRLPLRVKTNF